jgi:uncharacterized repeat protein (TIGR03803 family)
MGKFNLGTTAFGIFLLWAAAAIALPAQTTAMALAAPSFKTIHSFAGTDGSDSLTSLVQGPDGSLYGTTAWNGAYDSGTVFKISPNGKLTTLYSFCPSLPCTDGSLPAAGLALGADGNFYGTTLYGGGNNCEGTGCGTIFKITPNGNLTTLHRFDEATDGAWPTAGLVQGANGGFYGTTGGNSHGAHGNGTVFTITPSGQLTTLHTFSFREGSGPNGLVLGADGSFYGTAYGGGADGACSMGVGCGTVFKITPSGNLTTLYNFGHGGHGNEPIAGLVQGTDGNFYGTTYSGGTSGYGTVFTITPGGKLTTLHRFDGADGAYPSGLIKGTDGNFYGTTCMGGANNQGNVFAITPGGVLTALYNFCSQANCADGANPEGALFQDTNGTFYGTTSDGGANGDVCMFGSCGTVFSFSVGMGPFVETNPTSGAVGAPVKILGTNVSGATGVTFNGTAAAFTVVSNSLIATTVPAGATTGKVKVTFPIGMRSSNVPFQVQP